MKYTLEVFSGFILSMSVPVQAYANGVKFSLINLVIVALVMILMWVCISGFYISNHIKVIREYEQRKNKIMHEHAEWMKNH